MGHEDFRTSSWPTPPDVFVECVGMCVRVRESVCNCLRFVSLRVCKRASEREREREREGQGDERERDREREGGRERERE